MKKILCLLLMLFVAVPVWAASDTETGFCVSMGSLAARAAVSRDQGVPLKVAEQELAGAFIDTNYDGPDASMWFAVLRHTYASGESPETARSTTLRTCLEHGELL